MFSDSIESRPKPLMQAHSHWMVVLTTSRWFKAHRPGFVPECSRIIESGSQVEMQEFRSELGGLFGPLHLQVVFHHGNAVFHGVSHTVKTRPKQLNTQLPQFNRMFDTNELVLALRATSQLPLTDA